jgi:hypothetical protein
MGVRGKVRLLCCGGGLPTPVLWLCDRDNKGMVQPPKDLAVMVCVACSGAMWGERDSRGADAMLNPESQERGAPPGKDSPSSGDPQAHVQPRPASGIRPGSQQPCLCCLSNSNTHQCGVTMDPGVPN